MSKKKTILNVITEILGRIITIILGIVLPKLYIDSFGSEINGLISSVTNILVYVNLLEAGIGGASIQALYKVINDDKNAVNSILAATDKFYKRIGIYYLAIVCAIAFLYPICVKSSIDFWIVVAIILLSAVPSGLKYYFQGKYTVLLQADNRAYVSSIINNIINIITNITKIILLLNGCSVIIIQIAYCIIDVVRLFMYYLYVKKKYTYLNLHVTPDEAKINKKNYVLIHNIAGTIFLNIDVLVLTLFTDLKLVSIYCVYNMIFGNIGNLIKSISTAVRAYLGQCYYYSQDQFKKIRSIISVGYRVIVFALITSCGVLILPFLRIYTSSFTDANYIDLLLPFLFVSTNYLDSVRGIDNACINATGFFKETLVQTLVETGINGVLSIVLVFKYGIYGALVATTVALLYRSLDMVIFVNKKIVNEKYVKDVIYILVSWLISIVCVKYSEGIVTCDNYLNFFVIAIVCTFFCGLLGIIISLVFYRKQYKYMYGFAKKYMISMGKKIRGI